MRVMTPTHRVKDPADAALPCSSEARSPQGTGPFVLSFNLAPRLPRGERSPDHRSLTNSTERSAGIQPALRSPLAGAEARPRLPCPISGVPTHKHRPARCACALGRPPVACSDAPLVCANQPRRVWTQPRWFLPRWTSGEVPGPSNQRGGFNSRTGYHSSTQARRRTHASRGANRPQRLGGVGTRYRQPFQSGRSSPRESICFGSRGLHVQVVPLGPFMSP